MHAIRSLKAGFSILAISAAISSTTPASATEPSYDLVSRCFFTAAPVSQLARDLPNEELKRFGYDRSVWLARYVKSNQGNEAFQKAFKQSLASDQQLADAMEDGIRRALAEGNQRELEGVLAPVVACDKALGLPTPPMPHI